MTFDPPSLPPAGWYPDPEGRPQQRYWNGYSWENSWDTGPFGGDGSTGYYPDIGDWLTEAFRSMWRHVRAEAFVAVLTAVPATIALFIGIRVGLADLRVEDGELIGWSNDRIPTLVALGVVAIVIFSIGSLAASWLGLRIVDRTDRAAAPSIPHEVTTSSEFRFALQAIAAGTKAIPRAIGWTVLPMLGAFAVLTLLAVWTLGLFVIAVILAIPLLVWLAVRLSLIWVALLDRRGNPYRRSWQATDGKFWSTFGRLLLLGLITSGISIAISLATSPFDAAGSSFGQEVVIEVDADDNIERVDFGSLRPGIVAIIAGAIGTIANSVAITGTSAIAMGRLYRTGGIPAEHEPRTVSTGY